MVTPAGRDLLKNSIYTAKFHNRILEENDMWRQWELEKGLTMMVSDDIIRKKSKHRCSYHERKKKAKMDEERHKTRNQGTSPILTKSSVQVPSVDKWDHSGFAELYPEGASNSKIKDSKQKDQKPRLKNGTDSESSNEDVWRDFKQFKKSLKSKNSALTRKKNIRKDKKHVKKKAKKS